MTSDDIKKVQILGWYVGLLHWRSIIAQAIRLHHTDFKQLRNMNRQEEFEMLLEELIKEFPDLSYGQLVESLEHYADRCRRKVE